MSTTNNSPASTLQTPVLAPMGNIAFNYLLNATLTPAAVGAATTAEQTFTVTGLVVGDFVEISKPTTQAGLGIVNVRVSAANTLAIAFGNNTAGSLTPTAAEVYVIKVTRPVTNQVGSALPTALPLTGN